MSNLVSITNCDFRLSEDFSLRALSLEVAPGQQWVIIGPNGSGKSALISVLAGEAELTKGVDPQIEQSQVVSFETQRALIEAERRADDSDITDTVFEGTKVRDLLKGSDPEIVERLTAEFGIDDKLDRGFRQLSTGETRKVLLIKAIASPAKMLLLDEPFEGLDVGSCEALSNLLEHLTKTKTMVLALNRRSEIPNWLTHVCVMAQGQVALLAEANDGKKQLQQLMQIQSHDIHVPKSEQHHRQLPNFSQPLVRLKKARVAYGDNVVFSNLDWQVDIGEHWQVVGPNGSGKTCLLNLISGDHPQCYVNDIFVVGYQRGQGESIWDIKQNIGYVSSQLQWEYRVSINLLNVILSGFYDSIGLYEKATDEQLEIAYAWLTLLGLRDRHDQPLNQCSYGDQRMLLIARAMVKHPWLLILDEPCLGLDDMNRQLVLTLIEKICRSNTTTVLYVNHHAQDQIPAIKRQLDLVDFR